MKSFFLLFLTLAGAIYLDNTAKEPIFPDPLYCLAGAGTIISVPESTRTTSWRINPRGGPDIPNGWTTDPAYTECVHETVWRGWKRLYDNQLGPSFKTTSLFVSAPKVCHAGGSNQLAEWFNRSLTTKPELANGFSRCMDSISSFQENFLKKLEAEASSATSRSAQLSLLERTKTIRSNLEVDRKSACLKVALSSLRIKPPGPGGVGPEGLGALEAHFKNGPWVGGTRKENVNAADEVVQLADRKLNDLTSSGKAELAESIPKMVMTDGYPGPRDFLPDTYGNKAFGSGPTPLLDKWVESVTTSMECH